MNHNLMIVIAAAVITREDGRLLLVRKHGSDIFIQPGGKIEVGEHPRQALCRELHEELGLWVAEQELAPLGRGSAPAANEAGHTVRAEFFGLQLPQALADGLQVAAELAELRWIDPAQPGDLPIAALSRAFVLPRFGPMR